MNIVIKKAKYILTPCLTKPLLLVEDRDIEIRDGLIKRVGRNIETQGADLVINAEKHLVMPGFVDGLYRLGFDIVYTLLYNRLSENVFKEIVSNYNKFFDEETLDILSRIVCISSLLNGSTGLVLYTPHPIKTMEVCREYGLNLSIGFPQSMLLKNILESLARVARDSGVKRLYVVVDQYEYGRIDELMDLISLARDHGVWRILSVSRSREQVFEFKKTSGKWLVEILYEKNLLDASTVLAYLNWVSSMEIEFIKTIGSSTIVIPWSSTYLGGKGFTPIQLLLSKDIPVSIGSDGLENDIRGLYHDTYRLYRMIYGDQRLDLSKIYSTFLRNGYRYLGVDGGVIYENYVATLILIPVEKIRYMLYSEEALLHNILGTRGLEPTYVLVNGEIALTPEYREHMYNKLMEERRRLAKHLPTIHSHLNDLITGME